MSRIRHRSPTARAAELLQMVRHAEPLGRVPMNRRQRREAARAARRETVKASRHD
jgi:hypothetical protein